MGFQLSGRRVLSGFVLSTILIAVTGCQSGAGGGPLNLGLTSDKQEPAADQQDMVRESELRAYCPPVNLRSGTAYYTTYKGNDEGDPENAIYQAAITDVTRNCRYNSGSATMTIAVAGKVVPGPSGRTGKITLPIRVAAMRGDDVIYSKLFAYDVVINDTAESAQFVFTDTNVTLPSPVDRSIRVMVGYDEGAK